jgi:GTP-binding protein
MAVPQVVIVGRPNVGKSSVFNWLAGRRLSIVDEVAGVTRDRVTYLMEADDRYFELVDTGGLGGNDVDNLTREIEDQITLALESADVVLFVVDTRTGVVPLDRDVATRLRYIDKPIICVANKCDDATFDTQAYEFYKLGRGKLVRVSAQQNRNREELIDMIIERLPEVQHMDPMSTSEPEMKVAIVGRRNVGKSTFVNTLAQTDRMIVSEVPGTTRDSVDVRFEMDGKVLVAIDTPGLLRTKSIKTDVDFYSTHRAHRSIRRADIVLMFFDCSERIGRVDKQLVQYIADNYKPCVFVVNKWDLMHGKLPTEKWVSYLRENFKSMWHVPIAFITGETGKNVKALVNHTQNLFRQSLQRVGTGELNRMIQRAVEHFSPPIYQRRQPKIYYATQVSVQPPTIVMIVNNPVAFSPQYRRYLLGVLRDQLSFGEVPIKLYLHKRRENDRREEIRHANVKTAEVADEEE